MDTWEYILVAIYEGKVTHINDIPLPEFLGIKWNPPHQGNNTGYYEREFSDNPYDVINTLGRGGWEMVGILPSAYNITPDTENYCIYFKRSI